MSFPVFVRAEVRRLRRANKTLAVNVALLQTVVNVFFSHMHSAPAVPSPSCGWCLWVQRGGSKSNTLWGQNAFFILQPSDLNFNNNSFFLVNNTFKNKIAIN